MADINYLPYAQRAAEIERQRRYAELLQQQAADPLQSQMVGGRVVPLSPWLGLAKVLQAGLGGYAQRKATEAEAELKKQSREEANKQIQGFIEGLGPQKVTTQTPVMQQDFGQAATPEDYQDMINNPQMGLAPKRRDISQAATPEDVQDIVNQPYEMKDVTSYKPGMNRSQALAKLLEMKSSDNPYLSDATSVLSGLMPKETSAMDLFNKLDMDKLTPESRQKVLETGDPSYAEFAPESKAPSYQRQTKEWSDKAGNKYKQDYAWNSATASMEPVGKAYLADVYHAPGTSKDDDTKAGATLRAEFNNNPVVRNHATVSASYENILNNEETGAGDMSLIYSYMKMLDQGTGVKEGEYANAENAGGIPEYIRNLYNKAKDGQKLQPSQRQQFISQAGKIYQTSKGQVDVIRTGIEQIGKDTGVNPRLYTLPEPKRRSKGTEELPPGFVVEPPASQSTFGSPQSSTKFHNVPIS